VIKNVGKGNGTVSLTRTLENTRGGERWGPRVHYPRINRRVCPLEWKKGVQYLPYIKRTLTWRKKGGGNMERNCPPLPATRGEEKVRFFSLVRRRVSRELGEKLGKEGEP